MERECANPRCFHLLSDRVSMSINHCGHCQRKLRQLAAVFPDGDLGDLFFLLHHGWANLIRVAHLLGLERRAVMGYRQKGLIRFEQKGKYAIATLEELVKFALWRKRLITMFQAARIMRVSYHTLKRLVCLGIVRPDFRSPNRIRYFDKTRLAEKKGIIQDWQGQKRARKIVSAQTKRLRYALSTMEMARILDMSLNGIWYQINQQRLVVFRCGRYVYATKRNFQDFCQKIAENHGGAIGYTKKQAQRYLDSLAAG